MGDKKQVIKKAPALYNPHILKAGAKVSENINFYNKVPSLTPYITFFFAVDNTQTSHGEYQYFTLFATFSF